MSPSRSNCDPRKSQDYHQQQEHSMGGGNGSAQQNAFNETGGFQKQAGRQLEAATQAQPQQQLRRQQQQANLDSTPRQPSCPQPRQNRQIKFVSTNGLPPLKRRRTQAACKTCRRRKIRCSGEKPKCKTCADCGHFCQGYAEPKTVNGAAGGTAKRPLGDDGSSKAGDGGDGGVRKHENEPRPGGFDSKRQKSVSGHTTPYSRSRSQSQHRSDHGSGSGSGSGSGGGGDRENILTRTHVPYFRYFGPTAIVPGYKQTVVRVQDSRKDHYQAQGSSRSPSRSPPARAARESGEALASLEDMFYHFNDDRPVNDLIIHLCEVFFTHLGSNFPFLQHDRYMRNLKQKKVEPILVDAVCALSARFSLHPLLVRVGREQKGKEGRGQHEGGLAHAHALQGTPFAQRAMLAVVEGLGCPTLPVVQACLLLAYEQFGSNKDSGLWNYLGIAIRMAQDLGIQKREGLKYSYGRLGPTPNALRCGLANDTDESVFEEEMFSEYPAAELEVELEERAMERETVDTFWSIFFLDRVISSGTGRPVTLRDKDIKVSFPRRCESILSDGSPSPFPTLLRVIHLYGRITDLLNGIEESDNASPDTLEKLVSIERDLTSIYQLLPPKLHFNVVNFQSYVKAGEGTNFILLHFWFHNLIVLLHRPMLMHSHSFDGRMQQLVPNTRELSLSSAKTIVDILAFAELIDAKSFIGNPFTTQPIYTSACAFLMEQQANSLALRHDDHSHRRELNIATAPQEDYQRCYRALKSIEVYWEGTEYILTVLDQKAKGIVDPELYSVEAMDLDESFKPRTLPPRWVPENMTSARVPAAAAAAAAAALGENNHSNDGLDESSRRLMANGGEHSAFDTDYLAALTDIDPSRAIGWALAGATGSAQPDVSFLYQLPVDAASSVESALPISTPQFEGVQGLRYEALHL